MSISARFPDIVEDVPNSYDDHESQLLVAEQLELGRNIGTLVTSRAAERDGAEVQWHGEYTAVATKNGRQVLLRGHMCTDTATSGLIVKDKLLTKQLLQDAGVATPEGGLARSPEEALKIQQELARPVVIKPRFGGQGKGVTVNVESAADIAEAFSRAQVRRGGVLVEEYIDGIEFRIIATPDKCFGAIRRLLPHVAGDGHSSVAELINNKNDARKRNPNNCKLMIPVDATTEHHLKRQGLTLDSVLSEGHRVIVRNVGGISSGGEASECLDLLDSQTKSLAQDAIHSIPTMDWGGVDILVSRSTGAALVLELNTNAAISNSTFPVYGAPRDIGGPAWDHMLRRARAKGGEVSSAVTVGSTVSIRDALREEGLVTSDELQDARSILGAYLRRRGWHVELRSDRLMRAYSSAHQDRWYNGLMDARFPASVSSLLRRHRTVRSILKVEGVPVPRAVNVENLQDIQAYRERSKGDVAIVPRDQDWSSHRKYSSSDGSLPGRKDSKLMAQRMVEGVYLRVFASRTHGLAVLTTDQSYLPANEETHPISRAAVDAVRAIPGLPWGVVDIVLPPEGPILVQGISAKIDLSKYPFLCAGSLTTVIEEISGL